MRSSCRAGRSERRSGAYARKIERGLSDQAEDGVFEAVATLASRRFGNLAKIRFTYRQPLAGGMADWAEGRKAKAAGSKREIQRQFLKDIRVPAIVVTR